MDEDDELAMLPSALMLVLLLACMMGSTTDLLRSRVVFCKNFGNFEDPWGPGVGEGVGGALGGLLLLIVCPPSSSSSLSSLSHSSYSTIS